MPDAARAIQACARRGQCHPTVQHRPLTQVASAHPTTFKAWADTAYRNTVIGHGATLGIDFEVVRRDPVALQNGFIGPDLA
jgi:hypothetical protein